MAGEKIITRVDAFAVALLDQAKGVGEETVPLEQKLQVFEQVAKWVAIKHRIAGGADDTEGSGIKELKNAIKAHPDRGKSGPGPAAKRKRAASVERDAATDEFTAGTDGLAALKQSLPRADDRRNGVDRHDAGGSVHSPGGGDRGLYVGLLSDIDPESADADSGGDV